MLWATHFNTVFFGLRDVDTDLSRSDYRRSEQYRSGCFDAQTFPAFPTYARGSNGSIDTRNARTDESMGLFLVVARTGPG